MVIKRGPPSAVAGEASRRKLQPLERAKAAWAFISALNGKEFLANATDPAKITQLPYPGISYPGPAPGYEIALIGTPELRELVEALDDILYKGYTHIQLVGSKGIGKSCRLRALACYAYATLPQMFRLVCLWNADFARKDLLHYVKDALHFTYFDEPEVVAVIMEIQDLVGVEQFLKQRAQQCNEEFTFIVDGAEALDSVTWVERSRVDAAMRAQDSLTLGYVLKNHRVIWGLSPKAFQIKQSRTRLTYGLVEVSVVEGLNDVALQKYMEKYILGILYDERHSDISFYGGRHPLSLNLLEQCCQQVAWNKHFMTMQGEQATQFQDIGIEDRAKMVEDDEDWYSVVNAFSEHMYFHSIRNSLRSHLELDKPRYRLEEMTDLDPRFALKSGEFCTPFIQQIYIEEFRSKEHEIELQPCGPWVGYCQKLLDGQFINWSEIGWICERLCGDVISRVGINISGELSIGHLVPVPFLHIPKVSSLSIGTGYGFLYIPVRYNFGQVDSVIVYQDLTGQLHFIGLQFTTNVAGHTHSRDEFMAVGVIEEWIPDVLVKKADWKFHYVFVCLKSAAPQEKEEKLSELRGGVTFGILAHRSHVVTFEEALENRAAPKVLELLRKMTQRRENEFKDKAQPIGQFPPIPQPTPLTVVPSTLKKFTRRGLNGIAKDGGLAPDRYKNKEQLIHDMVAKGILIVL